MLGRVAMRDRRCRGRHRRRRPGRVRRATGSCGTSRSRRATATTASRSSTGSSTLAGVRVVNISDRTFLMHLGGKIEIHNKVPIRTRDDLSMAYTPGVARVCLAITRRPPAGLRADDQAEHGGRRHRRHRGARPGRHRPRGGAAGDGRQGDALQGVRRRRRLADLPGHQGRGQDRRDGQATSRRASAASTWRTSRPRAASRSRSGCARSSTSPSSTTTSTARPWWCWRRCSTRCGSSKKPLRSLRVVVTGVGAAGTATIKILQSSGVRDIIGVDEHGTIHRGRTAGHGLHEALGGGRHQPPAGQGRAWPRRMQRADVFIGLSVPGILSVRDVKRMARDPIVFAMANPVPEIQPEEAERHVRVMATGRSDYPNQINNVLCFPGFFRGLLDSRARTVNDEMKLAAARALAACVARGELERGVHHPQRLQQERRARGGRGRGPRRLGHRRGAGAGAASTSPLVSVTAAPTRWSVVIPAFNEAARLPPYLDEVVGFFEGRGEPWEVRGGRRRLDGRHRGRCARGGRAPPSGPRAGPAAAQPRQGRARCARGCWPRRGAFRLFTDADGATPIARAEAAGAGAGGRRRRRHRLPRAARSRRRGARALASRGGRARLQLAGGAARAARHRRLAVRLQGLHGARRPQALFGALETQGFGFDVELLLRAQAAGYRVVEVAVNWDDQARKQGGRAQRRAGHARAGPGRAPRGSGGGR